MTRSDFSPACDSAGAKRSGRVRHQSTFPRVRAAIPAAKSAAAAPSIAPFPPPATSCSASSASPPLGSRESISARPKGNTDAARLFRPSTCRTWARKDSMADKGRTADPVLLGGTISHVLYLFSARDPSQDLSDSSGTVPCWRQGGIQGPAKGEGFLRKDIDCYQLPWPEHDPSAEFKLVGGAAREAFEVKFAGNSGTKGFTCIAPCISLQHG
jgi:hypothetical protein